MTDAELIYLASPYSHDDPAVVEQRFKAVCKVAGRLMREGHLIYSPIAHTHPIAVVCDLPKGWDFWERYDRAHLYVCSELWVLMLDGWLESRGVQAEREYMRSIGKPIRHIVPTEEDLE